MFVRTTRLIIIIKFYQQLYENTTTFTIFVTSIRTQRKIFSIFIHLHTCKEKRMQGEEEGNPHYLLTPGKLICKVRFLLCTQFSCITTKENETNW